MGKSQNLNLMLCCSLVFLGLVMLSQAQSPQQRDCPENEFYACGSACQTECRTLGKPCLIINIKCNEGCYCNVGYARDDNGKCIPIDQCLH